MKQELEAIRQRAISELEAAKGTAGTGNAARKVSGKKGRGHRNPEKNGKPVPLRSVP